MMEKITKLLTEKDYTVPNLLIKNYKKYDISSEEVIFLIYLINNDSVFNPKEISEALSMDLKDVMNFINNLTTKALISIETVKVNSIRNEYINLEGLYKKLAFSIIDEKTNENSSNIFDIFEKEFGRTLSPMEYEIINKWLENFKEQTIILALKEATYNGVSNLRYIDKILYEWKKKGIETEDDILKDRKKYKVRRELPEKIDYDWLNEE